MSQSVVEARVGFHQHTNNILYKFPQNLEKKIDTINTNFIIWLHLRLTIQIPTIKSEPLNCKSVLKWPLFSDQTNT